MSGDEDGVRASPVFMDSLKANGIVQGKDSAGRARTTHRDRGHVFSGGQHPGHFPQRAARKGAAEHWTTALRPATKRHSYPRAVSSGDRGCFQPMYGEVWSTGGKRVYRRAGA